MLSPRRIAIVGFGSSARGRPSTPSRPVCSPYPDTASARRHARTLADGPHIAGTPAQTVTANYVLRQMASWGLDTVRVPFRVYLPYHDSTIVERVGQKRRRLELDEPAIAGDPTTTSRDRWVAMNGNAGSGTSLRP